MQISIGPSFFQVEKQNYSDYRMAFFRELFQNSVDQGASRIEIGVVNDPEGAVVTFSDNGNGMTRNVLENVYLVMGETTKKGNSNSIGGYGRARTLINWAMRSYEIRSHDYLLKGCGASYEIENAEFKRGCEFKIATDIPENILLNKLEYFLSKSRIPCPVYLNGQQQKTGYHLGKYCRNLSFGAVYLNKSSNKNELNVRVNGVLMFSQYLSQDICVTVELESHRSREILSATRDNLQYEFQRELNDFVQKLAVDKQSALKDRSKKMMKFFGKDRAFAGKIKEKVVKLTGCFSSVENAATCQVNIYKEKETTESFESFVGSYRDEPSILDEIPQAEIARYGCEYLDSMLLYVDTENPALKRAVNYYDPENGEIGKDRHKFIRQWGAICQIVSDEMSQMLGTSIIWAPGLCFDDDALAMHMASEGIHYIMIAPVDKMGKICYSLNNRADLVKLIISATHEFTHVTREYHDENFTILNDRINERVFARLNDVIHATKAAKDI